VSATLRAFAIIGGVLLVGFGFFPLFVYVFGAPIDPLRAFLVWLVLVLVLVTIAVLVVGINLAVRRRRRGLNPVPVDAATLGAIVLLGVLAVVFLFPLTER
jgi:vacuolar-type H+-ATPase subunit I/STV1